MGYARVSMMATRMRIAYGWITADILIAGALLFSFRARRIPFYRWPLTRVESSQEWSRILICWQQLQSRTLFIFTPPEPVTAVCASYTGSGNPMFMGSHAIGTQGRIDTHGGMVG